jgi:putative ABC transport system permease protein
MSIDGFQEVLTVIRHHKLRTLLTALSVAWGIFLLILLLGAGDGLQHGIEHDFRDDAVNSIWVRPAKTSIPHQGLQPGRSIRFVNDDLDALRRDISGIEHMTGRYHIWGGLPVSYRGKSATFDLRGCHPDHLHLEKTVLLRGRFINDADVKQRRKVAVLSPEVQAALFPAEQDPLGEYINIRGVNYQVVGLYTDEGMENELRKIYIPISTAQLVYHAGDQLHAIMYTVGDASLEESTRMADVTRQILSQRHDFSPQDRRAVFINNNLEAFQRVKQIFTWVGSFVWFVGVGTILAGMIGVSNVMLVSVKERTVEIGIRKALGATPASIVGMILSEALFITSIAGYAGLIAGVAVVELVSRWLPPNDYLKHPQVDFRVALLATLVIISTGMLAGLVPALRAARIKPVKAIRDR